MCRGGRFSGVSFLLIITIAAYFAGIWLLIPIITIPFYVSLYRKINDWIVAAWFRLVSALLELVLRIRVKVSGDCKLLEGPCLIILNHRTRFDWLFAWCFMLRFGKLTTHKIILKSSLKKLPIFGWATQAAQFIFLSRNWSNDEKYMTDSLNYYTSQQYPIQLLIFPEGTDLSESNKSKDHKYAEEHGLQKFDYVLHPKTKGFVHCIQALRQSGKPISIYDMTVGYVGDIPQNETDIVMGRWPAEIHFDCSHIPHSQLPSDESQLEQWIKTCWQKKEDKLKAFYSNGHFDTPYFPECSCSRIQLSMLVTLVLWAAFHIATLYCFYQFSLLRWYFLVATIAFVVLTSFTNGLETIVLRMYR